MEFGNPNSERMKKLLPQLELLGDRLVPTGVGRMQVIEQAAALANHHQQATTRAVIFLVALQVLRERIDPVREQSDLDIGRAGVLFMQAKAFNNLRLV